MSPSFHNFSFFHYHDLVGMFYGAQPVCYHYDRSSMKKFFKIPHNHGFIVGIQRIGGLIEEQQMRVFVNGSRNEYALFLPLTNAITFGANFGMITQRNRLDKRVNIGRMRCPV